MTWQARVLADSLDREAWTRARANRIGASDAGVFAKLTSAPGYARSKLNNHFTGNAYTDHGNRRESFILRARGFDRNTLLVHSENNKRHVATPDGIRTDNGALILAEAKTTNKPFKTIPPKYLRQVAWQQYVLGAEQTEFIWEVHEGFIPTELDPLSLTIPRNEPMIADLITIADRVLTLLDSANAFSKELENVN